MVGQGIIKEVRGIIIMNSKEAFKRYQESQYIPWEFAKPGKYKVTKTKQRKMDDYE